MTQKLVFFDIDNTIWDANKNIPESTKEAVAALKRNGHKAVICSGRTRAFIRDADLLSMNFDGIVAGCGTMAEYEGKTLFNHVVDDETALFCVELIRECGFGAILEGPRYLYLDAEDFAGLPDRGYIDAVSAEMGEDLRSIKKCWGEWEMNKFAVSSNPETKERFFSALEPMFTPIFHNDLVAELVPKGFDKAAGMMRLCDYLGVDRADTYAFGDSTNDIDMLRAAGTGIAMGNAHPLAKEAADYVTVSLWDDGIKRGLRHFNLI